ncbi:unnamed protein product, partial [Discosporangium mesarthrocarpum]
AKGGPKAGSGAGAGGGGKSSSTDDKVTVAEAPTTGASRGRKSGGLREIWEAGPAAEEALRRFEQERKTWVDAGRPTPSPTSPSEREADGATTALSGNDQHAHWNPDKALRQVDALVRGVQPDALAALPYLRRLGEALGQTPEEVRARLVELEQQELMEMAASTGKSSAALQDTLIEELAKRVSNQKGTGETVFLWDIALRKALHDCMKAHEAWSKAQYLCSRAGNSKGKDTANVGRGVWLKTSSAQHFDELASKWPPDLPMTADELRKMYQLEKRRIINKAKSPSQPRSSAGSASSGSEAVGVGGGAGARQGARVGAAAG